MIWLLDDSYSRDGKWARGQVEVKAVEITDEFEYRVNIDIFYELNVESLKFSHL